MEYAVIRIGGKQYRVSKGDVLLVDRLDTEKSGQVVFEDVLLLASDGNVRIGKPMIPGIKIKAKVLEQKKGKKIRIAKFKAKVRYRRVMGFRPLFTRLQIIDIQTSDANRARRTTRKKRS